MQRLVTICAVALAAVLAVPVGVNAWGTYGGNEPNTAYDRTGGYMYTGLPTSANQVYFDVMNTVGRGNGAGIGPNNPVLNDRLEAPGSEDFLAFLGVWVDCNKDGYIGMADGAQREYKAAESAAAGHPIDLTLCPDHSIHYDSGTDWVTELIPIGYGTDPTGARTPISTDPRTISDIGAKVWGDNLRPDGTSGAAAGCRIIFGSDAKGGQLHHTGGALQHADCLDRSAPDYARSLAVSLVPALSAVPVPSSIYNSPPVDQPTPALVGGPNQASNSFVSGEQDCSKNPTVDLSGPLQNSGTQPRGIRPVGTPRTNPNGNLPGTYNETAAELFVTGDCSTTDGHFSHNMYQPGGQVLESNGADSSSNDKQNADFNFLFRPWNNRWGCVGATSKLCGQPQDAGLPEAYNYGSVGQNAWTSGSLTGTTPSVANNAGGWVDRSTVPAKVTPDAFPGNWWTFYAYISSAVTAPVQTPGTGTYGSEWCTAGIGVGAGSQNGWDCNKADWNLDAATGQKLLNDGLMGTVGDTFQLRDVECYDTTAATMGSTVVGAHTLDGTHTVTKSTSACS